MERREFIKLCAASAAAGVGPAGAVTNATPHFYARVKLVDEAGVPLRAAGIPAHRNLIFLYPYAATPRLASCSISGDRSAPRLD